MHKYAQLMANEKVIGSITKMKWLVSGFQSLTQDGTRSQALIDKYHWRILVGQVVGAQIAIE